MSFSFSPRKTGLVIRFERCEKDLSSCTLLHFYPCLHSSVSDSLSPALLMRYGYPGADEPNPMTEGVGGGSPVLQFWHIPDQRRSTSASPFLISPPYCRIMSLQDGILRISESRCVASSCLISWPSAGGKTEGHGMWRGNQPAGLMLTFLKLAGQVARPDPTRCLCETEWEGGANLKHTEGWTDNDSII